MHGGVARTVLVFDIEGSVRGFIVARVLGDDCDIENIVVEKPLRRKGIASALLRELIQHARAQRARHILLEVRQSNAPAQKFYDNLGFVECGRRPSYYQDPEEDAICYRLELDRGGSWTPES
jgi:ribosomal-protein-alanine N-acetyltransferase